VPLVPVTIPDALLARLAALDDRCDVSMVRHTRHLGNARLSQREARGWRVCIWCRADQVQRGIVDVEGQCLAATLHKAVEQAERRWLR